MKSIDDIKRDIECKLDKYGFDSHKTVSAIYAIEEIVLLYNVDLDSVKYEVIKSDTELYIKLIIPGEYISVRQLEENNNIFIFDRIIHKTNFNLKQEYIGGKNIVILSLERYFTLINNIKFTSRFLDKNSKVLFKGYFYNIIAIIISIFTPILTGRVIVAYTKNLFTQAVGMSIGIFLSRISFQFLMGKATVCYNTVSFDLSNVLQTTLLQKLFTLTDETVEKNGSGKFIKRINDDTNEISTDITSLFNMISNGFYYLGVLIASLLYDRYVFIGEVITFIGLYFLENKRTQVLDTNRRRVSAANGIHSSLVLEEIYGSTEIKLLNAEDYFISKTRESANNVASISKESNRSKTILAFINSTYVYFCYMLIMIYLAYAIKIERISIPDALILYNYFTIISTPLISLIQRFMNFKKTFSFSCERCYNLLEGNEFPKEISGSKNLMDVKGDIEFKNVTFSYDTTDSKKLSPKILNNVSFKINAGENVAIVGKSGSGKSTILKLISGQYDCDLGTIEIDGEDILKINKKSLRESMSVISQTPFFFNASIRDNLRIVNPQASEKDIIYACKCAYIYDDIIETENGFDTILNEKGVRFSGGQRQRLAIARAILQNNRICIFDEATSALDNIVQDKIMKEVKTLGKGHTIITVAHRLSTIIDSDKIFMIDNGKIICEGKHTELMKKSKEYKELYTTK